MTKKIYQYLLLQVFLILNLATYSQISIDSVLSLSFNEYASDYQHYQPLFTQAIAQERVNPDSSKLALLLVRTNIIENLGGEPEASATLLLEAIQIYKKLNDQHGLGSSLSLLGYQLKNKDLQLAEQYMLQALKIQENLKDTNELMTTYDNYGVIKEFMNQLDSASYFYKASLGLKKLKRDTTGIPFSWNNLAIIAQMRKNYPKAIAYLDSSTQIRKRYNNPFYLGQNADAYGDLYLEWGKLDSAITYFKQSADYAKQSGANYLIRDAALELSHIYKRQGNYKDALEQRLLYEVYKDSITNENTTKNLNQLLVQYETAEKEKKIAEQNTLLAKETLKARNRQILVVVAFLVFILVITVVVYQLRIAKEKKEQAVREGELKLQSERVRVSRDLHDHIGSELTLIVSEAATQSRKVEQPEIKQKVQAMGENARNAMQQLRETIWVISQDSITVKDFALKLQKHCQRMCEASNLEAQFFENIGDGKEVLGPSVTINLYRVCQEAINNACKYANGKTIQLHFETVQDRFHVSVKDDGVGFDINNSELGYGLVNMQARMKEIGGEITISAQKNQGCFIALNAPFNSNFV